MTDDVTSTAPSEDTVGQDDRPLIDPDTGWNRLMVEQMARSIDVAHQLNPNSWAVHIWSGQPILSVGFLNVISVGPTQPYGLLVDTTILDEAARSLARSRQDANKRYGDERPWASYLGVPPNEAIQILEVLGSSHIAAVTRCAEQVQTHAHRWRDHREDFRKQIERVAEVSLPQPSYLEKLLTLQALVPAPPVTAMYNHTTAQQMARSILAAHELGTSCWSVFETAGRIALNVGQETVGGSSVAGMYDFVVDRQIVDAERLAWLHQYEKPKQTDSYPSLLFLQLPGDGETDYLADLHDAHVSALKTLTTIYQKATLWKTHRENLRKQVEKMSGIALPIPGYIDDDQPDLMTTIAAHFASEGLQYTHAQIATFYTALQTKGFVVLSGISGTGKSKIAQGFVDMMPTPDPESGPVPTNIEGYIRVLRMPSYANHGNTTLPTARISGYTFPMESSSWKITTRLNDAVESGTLRVSWYATGARLVQVHSKGAVRAGISEIPSGAWFYAKPETDPESGQISSVEFFRDVLRVDQEKSQESPVLGENHLFLSVRPDWRDSTSLLGYFNPLTQTYEWTDFLRFILRAVDSYRARDGLAWFVILDEMNLAHVEYYFADLLSVIEAGRQPGGEDAGFTREPLRTTYPDTLDDEMPPREIFLPPNLYIIGTVNMDETTHAFSPKVLDRAFTIELTDVSFDDYPPAASANGDADVTESDKRALLAAFTRDGRFHGVDKDEVARAVMDHQEFREWLGELNRLLAKDRFHFGYRTFDEIAQYIVNNDLNGMMAFGDAFDQAVFMKVLPKFSGSRARLRSPLISVLAWAIDPAEPLPKAVVADLDTHLAGTSEALATQVQGATVPRVARRALEMLERVELDGFGSFG